MSEQIKTENLDKQELQKVINSLEGNSGQITLGELLAGGVVSDVYQAELLTSDGGTKMIVVKYTKSQIPAGGNFSTMDIKNSFSLAPATHNLDVEIQAQLSEIIRTPRIIKHFSKQHITLMEDFTKEGYKLLQFLLLEDGITDEQIAELGQMVATIRHHFEENFSDLESVETPTLQAEERFYELKGLLYNGRMDIFNKIMDDFLTESKNSGVIWTDGDQKNFAVNPEGRVISFDFGRSVKCDPEFMPANLAGHLGLFVLGGYLKIEMVEKVLAAFVKKYQTYHPEYQLPEEKIVNYFTASLLHRGMAMRWVDKRLADKIGQDSFTNASSHFGNIIFDPKNRVVTIQKMLDILDAISKLAQEGKYRNPEINI
jgi:hypothetical protein